MLNTFASFLLKPSVCLFVLLTGIVACYFNIVGQGDYGDYYWMLGEAFLSGRTYIPDALFDTSYFNGKTYLYWGPIPVVMVYIPIKLLTGIGVKAQFMVPFLASIGTICLTILSYKIASSRQRVNLLGLIFVVLSIGFGTSLLFISRVPAVGTSAVSGAYCFTSMGALFLWVFLNNQQKKGWAIFASLCFGLAVGCRITHVTNIILLLSAYFMVLRSPITCASKCADAIRLFLPWGLVMLSLAVYNYERFGNPMETGTAYQNLNKDNDAYDRIMNGTIPRTNRFFLPCVTCSTPYFKKEYIPYNLYYYLLNPLRYGNIATPDENQNPLALHNLIPSENAPNTLIFPSIDSFLSKQGFANPGAERTYGLFAFSPFSLWFIAFLFHRNIWKDYSPATRNMMVGMLCFSLVIMLVLYSFQWHAQRYSPDFSVWVMALGGIYYLHLLQRVEGTAFFRPLLMIGGVATLYSIFTGFAVGYCAWDHC